MLSQGLFAGLKGENANLQGGMHLDLLSITADSKCFPAAPGLQYQPPPPRILNLNLIRPVGPSSSSQEMKVLEELVKGN